MFLFTIEGSMFQKKGSFFAEQNSACLQFKTFLLKVMLAMRKDFVYDLQRKNANIFRSIENLFFSFFQWTFVDNGASHCRRK